MVSTYTIRYFIFVSCIRFYYPRPTYFPIPEHFASSFYSFSDLFFSSLSTASQCGRKFRPRPHVGEFPAPLQAAGQSGIRIPAVRIPRDAEETPVPQGRRALHSGQS